MIQTSPNPLAPATRFVPAKAFAFFALVLVNIWVVDRAVAATCVTDVAKKYEALYGPGELGDTLILGSSTMAYGVNPGQLSGVGTVYNFAFAAASADFYKAWWPLYRARHKAPRTVILGAEWMTLHEGHLFRRLEVDSGYLSVGDLLGLLRRPDLDLALAVANVMSFARDRKFFEARLTGQPMRFSADMTRYDRGFAPIVAKTPYLDGPTSPTLVSAPLVKAYEDVLGTLKADGIRTVMVQPPEYGPGHPADSALLADIAARHGCRFLSYNGPLGGALSGDRTAFADLNHLNEHGAKRFGELLARDLAGLNSP